LKNNRWQTDAVPQKGAAPRFSCTGRNRISKKINREQRSRDVVGLSEDDRESQFVNLAKRIARF
jgi:hypothetical protein